MERRSINCIIQKAMKKQFNNGDVRRLQEYVAEKIKEWGFDDETLHERLLLLTEELGELVNACRKISGMNVDEKRVITNEAGEEIADMINLVFAVAIKLGIDVEKEFLKKIEKVDKRVYKRKETGLVQ